ncbi:MAG: aromatic amino acid lyase [Campylobacteraceae bacterium]|nr:aromatic amino acid lyase [Campylobacteraceae bacterium]
MKLIIDDRYIALSELIGATSVSVSSEDSFCHTFNKGHDFLMKQIRDGKPIHGLSGKNYLACEESALSQQNLYRSHACGVGEFLTPEISKLMVIIRLISLAKGRSGISYEALKRLEMLLEADIFPVIPSLGSVGASGDLTLLSYIAAVVAGEGEVWFDGRIFSTESIYEKLNITPYTFKPKEALAIMNGTAGMSAIALDSLRLFESLLDSMESFVAGIFEVLQNDTTPLENFVHESKPFEGQIQSASNIKEKLNGSGLTHKLGERYDKFFVDSEFNIQDNYSLRCAPQILGVVRDNLELSKKWVEQEINSVNDDPLIDGTNEVIYASGNFYGGYVAHAMDTLKICVANVADLLDKEFALLVDDKFNRGLGENLKLRKEHYFHGFKAMQITLSSLSADIIKNTTAASTHSRPTESLKQDKVSMGTTAALDFQKMMEPLSLMLSIAFIGLAQAVDIIGKTKASPTLQKHYDIIRSCVKPLMEDRRMDGDIYAIKTKVTGGELA